MKKLIATFAITAGLFGASVVVAPPASACYEAIECGAIMGYLLTRVLF